MEVWHFHEYGCLAGGKFSWFWRVILDRMFGGNDDFDKFFYLDELYLFLESTYPLISYIRIEDVLKKFAFRAYLPRYIYVKQIFAHFDTHNTRLCSSFDSNHLSVTLFTKLNVYFTLTVYLKRNNAIPLTFNKLSR